MREDSLGGREDKMAKLSGGKNIAGPLLEIRKQDIVPGGDDSDLVDPANEFNDDLLAPVIIDDLKLTNVVVLLHDPEELDEHLRDRLKQHLLLTLALGIDDRAESVREDVDLDHWNKLLK